MISILIPAYNVDVRPLVYRLHDQCKAEEIEFEIRVVDDGSDFSFVECFHEVDELSDVYVASQQNKGRSFTRNRLVAEAQFDRLLFIDADCKPASDEFIHRYCEQIKSCTQNDIYIGGISYPPKPQDKNLHLHWHHGKKREEVSLTIKNKNPERYFFTANICARKSSFQSIRFDQSIDGYGYEDILMGAELQKQGVTLEHIENPVLHLGLKENSRFILATKEAMSNLAILHNEGRLSTKLTNTYNGLSRWKILSLTMGVLGIVDPLIYRWVLLFPSHLRVLDALKLMSFHNAMNRIIIRKGI